MGTRRSPLLAAGLGLAVAAAILACMELGAGLVEGHRVPDHSAPLPAVADDVVMPPHPYLLWEHRPGERQEMGVAVTINSLGLRGPEPATPKPPGVRRIMAVGDSSVYGFGVPLEDSFTEVATLDLGGQQRGIEGMTAALPGYSTLQLLNLLQLRALALEPDLVVLAALWSDNATAKVQDAQLLDRYQRFDSSLAGIVDRGLQRSALYRVMRWELGVQRGTQATARAHYTPADQDPAGSLHRVPIERYRDNLEALADLVDQRGAELAVLVLPHPDDLNPHDRGQPSFIAYRDALRALADRRDAPLVDGATVFAQAAAQDPTLNRQALFLDNIHPTARGHALLGHALAEVLQDWEFETRPE